MEQFQKKEVADKPYRILFHPNVQSDIGKLDPPSAEFLLDIVSKRLSHRPEYIGIPLKGTANKLWKLRISKYRVVFTIMIKSHEVWILSLQPRDIVYRPQHIESLLRLAISIHQSKLT